MAQSGDRTDKPREWRRRILVPARMRSTAGWGDARILNVSSKGMMVHTPHSVEVGSIIELRRGAQTFVAQVMWKEGPRAGLMADAVLPLTDILCMSESAATASEPLESRSLSRACDSDGQLYRARGKLIELAIMTLVACSIAIAVSSIMGETLNRQLVAVASALEG